MPNYVYSVITLSSPPSPQQLRILRNIYSSEGLCRYYSPEPSSIHSDWYNWRINHWGTKWGDTDFCITYSPDTTITFSSAWSPISDSIIHSFSLDFPDFQYFWEEEQGFGQSYSYHNSLLISEDSWDSPPWGSPPWDFHNILHDLDITYLSSDYSKLDSTYLKGYYDYYSLDSFISSDVRDILPLYYSFLQNSPINL